MPIILEVSLFFCPFWIFGVSCSSVLPVLGEDLIYFREKEVLLLSVINGIGR